MAVVSVFFPRTNGRDIHLLPGLVSPRLDHLLHIDDTTGVFRADAPPTGVRTHFQALFLDQPSAHGVTFSETTREIAVAAALPAGPRLRSFIVLGSCDGGGTRQIRVHVHEAITDMWITPSTLHLRQGAKNVRLSVLARFDDGVIGDITNWCPFETPVAADRTFVRRNGETTPALVWSRTTPGAVAVDPVTGVLTGGAAAGPVQITVERRPVPAPPARSATATVIGAPPWSTPVRLTHVQGLGFSGMARSRNVLFLPEGFVDSPAEKRQFGQTVRGIVSRLTCRPQTTPFDLLSQAKAFNYFMAWVPSPEAGVTVLNEQHRENISGNRSDGRAMEQPVPGRAGVLAWSLEELLYEVGAPTPRLDPVGSPLGTDTTGRVKEWRELYGNIITASLVTAAYPLWLARSTRVLLNERDTAFQLSMGDRPTLDDPMAPRRVGLNNLRLAADDLNLFLTALADDRGVSVGSAWASGGNDEDLVVFLCRSTRNGGTNAPRRPSGKNLALTLGNSGVHRIEEDPATHQFSLVPDPIPADVAVDTWVTVAHELAHSWAVDDEYGGGGAMGDARADKLAAKSNLQPRKTLLTANSLDADKIKWRWPRIAKAGVVVSTPTDASGVGAGPFRATMQKGHGYQFGRGDIVRLRTRPLPTSVTSDRLRISRMLADGDEIELVPLPGSVITIGNFLGGSVLISPKRAPDNADGTPGADLELVHPTVRARINATRNPLNAADGAPPNRPCAGAAPTPTAARNFPGGVAPRPPLLSSFIVGLYEGGDTFDCDVYRPTGVCIMRRSRFLDVVTNRDRAYEFCAVCRYAIVDVVDPTQHPAVEATLAGRHLP